PHELQRYGPDRERQQRGNRRIRWPRRRLRQLPDADRSQLWRTTRVLMLTRTNRIRRISRSTLLMEKPMKKLSAAVLVGIVAVSTACEDFLAVNDNPNAPEEVSPNLYLPPMLHWMV